MSAVLKEVETETVSTMVFPANVMQMWASVVPLLEPSVEIMGTHRIEDVLNAIMAGRAQLWVGWNKILNSPDWAMVTLLKDYPLGLWLRVWLAGASPDRKVNWDEPERLALEFAIVNRCAGIEHWSREGWARRHESFCNTAKGFRLFRHRF